MEGLFGCCWLWRKESEKMDVVEVGFAIARAWIVGEGWWGPGLFVGCSVSLARLEEELPAGDHVCCPEAPLSQISL